MSQAELENGETIVKNRFLGFLIFLIFKAFLLSPFTHKPLTPSLLSFAVFIAYQISVLFSTAVAVVASPQLDRAASPLVLVLGIVKFLFVSGGPTVSSDYRRRARNTLSLVSFVIASAMSGFVSVVCIVQGSELFHQPKDLQK